MMAKITIYKQKTRMMTDVWPRHADLYSFQLSRIYTHSTIVTFVHYDIAAPKEIR